jgi:hypothetical protein
MIKYFNQTEFNQKEGSSFTQEVYVWTDAAVKVKNLDGKFGRLFFYKDQLRFLS